MSRSRRHFGLSAILLESLGGLLLLIVLFPAPPATQHQATGQLPTLQIPTIPMPGEDVRENVEREHADPDKAQQLAQRRQFVQHQLESSSRTMLALLSRHMQQLVHDVTR